ncbi:MAG TPA: hypothetical protein VGX25_29110, partial [Actinophytocola sp.]|uniref:hypothetical protein n=1 Tax=Actinophytocola sp. TaxID=1872138 RepID=UPI002DDDBAF5
GNSSRRVSGAAGVCLGVDPDDVYPVVVLSCDVELRSGSAAEVVDALARLQLTALRCGGRIRLRRVDPALLALLELAGLTELLGRGEPS